MPHLFLLASGLTTLRGMYLVSIGPTASSSRAYLSCNLTLDTPRGHFPGDDLDFEWLHAKNRLLDGEPPIDLLTEERYEEVRGGAESFIDGASV